jgi:hypothetical protein
MNSVRKAFPGPGTPEKIAANAKHGRNMYNAKVKALEDAWLTRHGMPRNVNKAAAANIRKTAKNFVKRHISATAFNQAHLAGGKRNTRRNRKSCRKTRRNRRN